VLADITRILGENEISIEAFMQKDNVDGSSQVPVVLLTHKTLEGRMNQAISAIEALNCVDGSVMRIRMETLD